MNYRVLLSIVTFFHLSYSCYALFISSPTSNSNIATGSSLLITWTETNITLFDIQLRAYSKDGNGTILSNLASSIKSIYNKQLVSIPSDLPAQDYSIALTHEDIEITSVGPLQLLPEIDAASPTEIATKSILVTSTTVSVISPTGNLGNSHLNATILDTENNAETEYIGGKNLGPTLSSGQVAIISIGIGACISVLFCIYLAAKSLVKKRRSSSTFSMTVGEYRDSDSQNSSQKDYYSSNNSSIRSIQSKKKVSVMEHIHEEDIHYDSMYYGQHFTEGFIETSGTQYLSSSHQQRSASPTNRISTDNHPFGQPPQNFNNNKYYIDLPLPPPNSYGSQYSYDIRRTSSPTVPPF